MNSLSRRLRKLEAVRGLGAPALLPLVYDILDANGLSVGSYLIAGNRFGEFRTARDVEVAALRAKNSQERSQEHSIRT